MSEATELDDDDMKRGFGEAFLETMRLLRVGPDTEEEWDLRETHLHGIVRASIPGAIGVTLARTLVNQPLVFMGGLLGLILWFGLEVVPFVYHLLT